MATQQLLVRLPEELARRLKRQVSARGRSAFVQRLLEQALAPDGGEDDPLYQAALEVVMPLPTRRRPGRALWSRRPRPGREALRYSTKCGQWTRLA